MKLALIAAAAALLAGCAAPALQGSENVREIAADAHSGCQFLRVVEVEGGPFYSSKTEAQRDMLRQLRNATLTAGGNAFAARTMVVERGFSLPFAQADAYHCPS